MEIQAFVASVSAWFDFRLRTANGWTWVWAPVATVAVITTANLVALALGVESAPFQSFYIVGALLMANRICIRAGLLATILSVPSFNYLIGSQRFHVAHIQAIGFHWPDGWEMVAWLSMFVGCLLIAPRRTRESTGRIFDRGTGLPFTDDRPDGANGADDQSLHHNGRRFWSVIATGVWFDDCIVGNEYSRIYAERIISGESRPLACWILRDMIVAGKFTGVEAGFIQGLSSICREALIAQRRAAQESTPREEPLRQS